MSEPREMTAEEMEEALDAIETDWPRCTDALRAHIAALTARAERARDAALDDAGEALRGMADMAQSLGHSVRSEAIRDARGVVLSFKVETEHG